MVYKAKKNNQTFAIKTIEKTKIRGIEKYIDQEIEIMKKLAAQNSKYTVRLYENFEDAVFLYLVMELCEGTLFNLIVKNQLNEQQSLHIFAELLKGFKELHENKIIHRDLKPENIFIQNNAYKIADFGVSKHNADITSSYAGTPHYMAPELIQKKPYNYKVDVWSLGVILYFMLFKEFPFRSSFNRLQEIQAATRPKFNLKAFVKQKDRLLGISDDLCELFSRIFVFDPQQRIGIQELTQNKLFRGEFQTQDMMQSKIMYDQFDKLWCQSDSQTEKDLLENLQKQHVSIILEYGEENQGGNEASNVEGGDK